MSAQFPFGNTPYTFWAGIFQNGLTVLNSGAIINGGMQLTGNLTITNGTITTNGPLSVSALTASGNLSVQGTSMFGSPVTINTPTGNISPSLVLMSDAPNPGATIQTPDVLDIIVNDSVAGQTAVYTKRAYFDVHGTFHSATLYLDEPTPGSVSWQGPGGVVGISNDFAPVQGITVTINQGATDGVRFFTAVPGAYVSQISQLSASGTWTATAFTATSSRDLKRSIADFMGDSLDIIERTNVRTFKRKAEGDDAPTRIGIVAEEAPSEITGPEGNGFDLAHTCAVLLDAVKTLTHRVKALEAARG